VYESAVASAKKRALQILITVLLVAGASIGGVYAYQAATRPAELSYRTAKVERGNVIGRVTATGTLSAHVTVLVGCQVSGRIAQLFADFNSTVKKNQVVAKIDPALFEAAVASARANRVQAEGQLAQAKAQLVLAQRNLERDKQLHAEALMDQADLDTAIAAVDAGRANVDAMRGNLEQARAQEHSAEVNLAYTTIISPIDGTVISRGVDVGQTVAASLAAPTLFTIAEDLRKMQVDTSVTEGDVGKLHDGMNATFLVDAYPNERFRGVIQQIRNAATVVQNVVTYDAVIDVENTDLKLRPGMTANVTIVYDRRQDVLRVPNAALRFRPPPALTAAFPSASAASPRGPAFVDAPPSTSAASPAPAPSGSAAPAASAAHAPSASASASASPAPSGSAGHWRNHQRGGEGGGGDMAPGTKTLWVMRGASPVPVQVRVGLTDGTLSEILSGDVKEGDAVVLEVTTADGDALPAGTAKPGGASGPRMRL
jgi:HlyD family secretion protein